MSKIISRLMHASSRLLMRD